MAKDAPPVVWENGFAVSQETQSSPGGAIIRPMIFSRGLIETVVTSQTHTVHVDTGQSHYTWVEDTRKARTFLVFRVGASFRFYRDKNYFVVVDHDNKRHFFILAGESVREYEAQPVHAVPVAAAPEPDSVPFPVVEGKH
jgi:hypothetical protein